MKKEEEETMMKILNMTDRDFNALNDAYWMTFDLDKRNARNARRRVGYYLRKNGLTLADWEAWLDT